MLLRPVKLRVALAAGFSTVSLLEDPAGSQACKTWGCAGVAAGAMLEPVGASLLLEWAWQLGQKHESVARIKGDTRGHRVMRGTAAIIGLSSSLLKILVRTQLVAKARRLRRQRSELPNRTPSAQRHSFLRPDTHAGCRRAGRGLRNRVRKRQA